MLIGISSLHISITNAVRLQFELVTPPLLKDSRIAHFRIKGPKNKVLLAKELLRILGILISLFDIYHFLRRYLLCRLLEKKEKEKRALKAQRKPAVLRPKSERDCRYCCEEKGKWIAAKRELPVTWRCARGGILDAIRIGRKVIVEIVVVS
jgi:hypothetical protein